MHDTVVRTAPAQIAGEGLLDLALGRRLVLLEQSLSCHDHPARAVAALRGLRFDERALHRLRCAIPGETIERGNMRVADRGDRHDARPNRRAVGPDRARPTV